MGATMMQTKFDSYIEKFNALALRMRVLFTFVLIAILFMLFDILWYSSTAQDSKKTRQEIEINQRQTIELIDIQNTLNTTVSKSRNNPKTQKIALLENEIEKIKEQLTEKTMNLIPSDEMASVLENIIRSTQSLKLVSLSKQASVKLSETGESTAKAQEQGINLYRHSLEIVLEGSYNATYEFLQNLENMERKVAFESFSYHVENYPKAEVRLVVSTLSLNKEWIGG